MRQKLKVKLFPYGEKGCDFEVYTGEAFFAQGKAASIEQAQARCNAVLGALIGEFEVVEVPAPVSEVARAPRRGKKFQAADSVEATDELASD